MKNNKLVYGMVLGALLGGLTTLFDRETRHRTKLQCQSLTRDGEYYLKHPSEAVKKARTACNQFNNTFNTSAESAINALEQVEKTIDTLTKKSEDKKLKSIN
ncbi:YtxH domain-containing protein [Virgibacillus flavescens]|uniref:YtxH domain-containing protein n=1 Tax=Virgibacillus flavescens TaxID=1611422 RepID=UPI003D333A49